MPNVFSHQQHHSSMTAFILFLVGIVHSQFVQADPYPHRHHHGPRAYYDGMVLETLPPHRIVVGFKGDRFFFANGHWYQQQGLRYLMTPPPYGIALPSIPPNTIRVVVKNVPYFQINGIYYQQTSQGYIVTEAPVTATAPPPMITRVENPTQPDDNETLFMYPKNQQTNTETDADQKACQNWASDKSGYSPGQFNSTAIQRSSYKRAFSACAEGRGYVVR